MKKVKDMPEKTVVIDELGKAEADAPGFQEHCSPAWIQRLSIGVLQKNTGAFTQAVAERPDVKVLRLQKKTGTASWKLSVKISKK